MLKKIRCGIKNIIDWLPIIWQDRDFDYEYLLIILRHKLKRMYDFFMSDYAVTHNAKHTAEEIKVVLDALNRIIEDHYFNLAMQGGDIIEFFKQAARLQNVDLHIAFNTLEEKVIEWWD